MKRLFIPFLLVFYFASPLLTAKESDKLTGPLKDIQQKIEQTFESARKTKDMTKMKDIINMLGEREKQKKSWINNYWQAFAYYHMSLLHLERGQKDEAKSFNEKAIEILEKIENPNSETYALMAQSVSYSITFINSALAASTSAKARQYVQKALKMNNKNLRAYYIQGRSDFYTPKQYGGGKVAEKSFLKALSLKETYSDKPNMPTWGKKQVYVFLVMFYQREGRTNDALLYCKKGLKKYPKYYALKKLEGSLKK